MSEQRQYLGPPGALDAYSFDSLDFSGVSMRSFLLRANQFQLERFCDGYLNQDIPEEMARFRPVGPFVLLQVLNYGRMSPVTNSLGWVAQNEVLFGVPVQGHWHEKGERVEGIASVSPFIFVDNDWSVATGREVYGWPKYPARIVPEVNPWTEDPREARRLLTLETFMFPRLYSGESLQQLVLLELTQDAPKLLQYPPDAGYLLNPMLQLPKAMVDTFALLPDLLQGLASSWAADGGRDLLGLMNQSLESMSQMPPETAFNTLNLKQFRSSEPAGVAYQSLVNARMKVKRFNGGGVLGTTELLRGDPSGGFTLYIHRYPDFPIIESLGLEVERQTTRKGAPVAALKPLMPYWVSLDMRYDRGDRLCWRARGTDWAMGDTTTKVPETNQRGQFNTALGPVVEAVEGPFDFYDTTIRVFPLKTKRPDLEGREKVRQELGLEPGEPPPDLLKLVAAGLKEPVIKAIKGLAGVWIQQVGGEDRRFTDAELAAKIEAVRVECEFADRAFLVVRKLGQMSADANDLGWWGGRSVELMSLLRLRISGLRELLEAVGADVEGQVPGDPDTLETHFLVVPYAFADNPLSVNAAREVLGLPTSFSAIVQGKDPWLESRQPVSDRCLLQTKVRDYPALGVGQGSDIRTLFEIHQVAADAAAPEAAAKEESPSFFGGKAEARDNFSIEALRSYTRRYGNGVQFPNLSLKQFRDEENPKLACYQALVAQHQVIGDWSSGGEGGGIEPESMPGRYVVKFDRLPSWPIVETLGLEVSKFEVTSEGASRAVCEVEHPFWLNVDLRQNLPLALRRQSVDEQWRLGSRSIEYMAYRLVKSAFDRFLSAMEEESEKELEKELGRVRDKRDRSESKSRSQRAAVLGFFREFFERVTSEFGKLLPPEIILDDGRLKSRLRIRSLDDLVRDVRKVARHRPPTAAHEIADRQAAYRKALRRGDAEAAAAFVSPHSRSAAAAEYEDFLALPNLRVEFLDDELEVSPGGDLAFESGTCFVKYSKEVKSKGGKTVKRTQKTEKEPYSVVWRKRDGEWLMDFFVHPPVATED